MTRSAASIIISAVPSSRFRSGPGAKELGLRPSIFVDMGAVWRCQATPKSRQPDREPTRPLTYQYQRPATASSPTHTTPSTTVPINAGRTVRERGRRRDHHHAFQEVYYGGSLEAAPFGRYRRELELAVRPLPHRYRQGAAQAAGRRHQALHLQRRNSILMTKLFKSAALAALLASGARLRAGYSGDGAGHRSAGPRPRRRQSRRHHRQLERLQGGAAAAAGHLQGADRSGQHAQGRRSRRSCSRSRDKFNRDRAAPGANQAALAQQAR